MKGRRCWTPQPPKCVRPHPWLHAEAGWGAELGPPSFSLKSTVHSFGLGLSDKFQKESLCPIIVIIVIIIVMVNQCFIPAPLYTLIFWKCPCESKLQEREKQRERTSQSQMVCQHSLFYSGEGGESPLNCNPQLKLLIKQH